MDARLDAARTFLAQSPPGETNDVFADLRVLVDDDAALETGIAPALEAYNVEQLIVASSSSPDQHQMIICAAGRLPDEPQRFADPRTRQSFAFDHMRVSLSDAAPLHVHDETEAARAELEREAEAYTAEHYASGVCAVYPASYPAAPAPAPVEPAAAEVAETDEQALLPDDEPPPETTEAEATPAPAAIVESSPAAVVEATPAVRTFTLAIVGNRYNPANFWTGRWRSLYTVDLERGTVEGTIALQTHYFEAGNVQLATRKAIHIDGTATAKDAVKRIGAAEKAYQLALNEAYADMTERSFKELRRALPVHKQKIDWNRITSYRLRQDLKRTEA